MGLGSVDNTADLDKPVSVAHQVALDLKSNKDGSNLEAGSVALAALGSDAVAAMVGGLDPAKFLGNVTDLSDSLADPTTSSGKWYFVDGIDGSMTGSNPPADDVEDGGYVFSDGVDWLARAASPTVIPNGSIGSAKLEPEAQTQLAHAEKVGDRYVTMDRPDIGFALVADDMTLISLWDLDGVETHSEREVHASGSITLEELEADVQTSLGYAEEVPQAKIDINQLESDFAALDGIAEFAAAQVFFDRPDLAFAVVAQDFSTIFSASINGELDARPKDAFITELEQIAEDVQNNLSAGPKILGTPSIGQSTRFLQFSGKTGVEGTWQPLPDLKTKSISLIPHSTEDISVRRNQSILSGRYYKGTWDASTGETPSPASTYEFKRGFWWLVSGSGTVDSISYAVGDVIIYEALNDHTSEFPYEDPVDGSLDGGDPAKRFRKIAATDTNDELYFYGLWDASTGDPTGFSTAPDGTCWECTVSGTQRERTWRVSDIIIKDSTTELGYRVDRYPSPTILTAGPTHPKTPLILPCSVSASEWEIKPVNTTSVLYLECEAMLEEELFAYTVLEGDNKKIWIENGFTGKIDKLQNLNSQTDNYDPVLSGNRLFFTSNRSGNELQYYAMMRKTPHGLGVEDVRPLRPERLIYSGGDSMGYQFRNELEDAIDAYDSGNAKAARTYHNGGRGSFGPDQITDRFHHWRDILDGGFKIGDGHQVIFLDRSTSSASKVETFELISKITAGIKHFILVGLFLEPEYSWTGSVIEPTNGKGSTTFKEVIELEEYFKKQFGINYINAREYLVDGANPNPLHPGFSNQEVFDAWGYYSPRYYKNEASTNSTMQDNPSVLVDGHFRGYCTAPPSIIGDEVAFDYQILRSGAPDEIGSLYIWGGASYELASLDRVHLYNDGNDVIAGEVVNRFQILGWE